MLKRVDCEAETRKSGQMKKTKYLFDSPVMRDWLFWVFCLFLLANAVNALQRVSNSGGINFSPVSAISGTIDAAVQVLITWVMILPIYLIRKSIRKRKNKDYVEIELQQDTPEMHDSELVVSDHRNKKKKRVILSISLMVIIIWSFVFSGKNTDYDADKYFEVQQLISAQVKEWNVAATPISQLVIRISNGTVGEAEARRVAGEASSNFALIHNDLRDACTNIPDYDVNSPGRDGAIALSYDALQVTCDLLPQESIEILALVAAQLSPISTQADLDYHSNQIASLIERRRLAVSKSIDALEPFATQAEKDQLARLKVMLNE